MKHLLALLILCVSPVLLYSQSAAGTLFIIGGGTRPLSLMQELIRAAALQKQDYIAVLPMASAEPAAAFSGVESELRALVPNKIIGFSGNHPTAVDSLAGAKLIFITGGDQQRFMTAVRNTAIPSAIRGAYQQGATIAGTSAGAAVMSGQMITGNQLLGDTTYKETFEKLKHGNIEFQPGLALLKPVIIDQHFVRRSRYNRLISALEAFPHYICLGIDESTALLVKGKRAKVIGESQVVMISDPQGMRVGVNGLIRLKDLKFSIFAAGDEFVLH